MHLVPFRALRSWPVCWASAGVALVVLSVSGIALFHVQREAGRLERERAELPAVIAPVTAEVPQETGDFARQLSHGPAEGEVLAELQRAATASHLTLAEVQFHDRRRGIAASLGHTSVTVSVKGSYAGIKSMLKDVLDRLPGTSVAHLSLRKSGIPDGSIDLTWHLSLWSAPEEPTQKVTP